MLVEIATTLVMLMPIVIVVFMIAFIDWHFRLKERKKQASKEVKQDVSLHIVTAQSSKSPTVYKASDLNRESERVTFYKS